MDRVRFVDHEGEEILLIDFSDTDPEDFQEIMDEAEEAIEDQPENSLLTLTDVSDAHFNKEVIDAMKQYTEHNRPYVKRATVVGIEGLKKVAYKSVVMFSDRDIEVFDTREEAKDWLVKED